MTTIGHTTPTLWAWKFFILLFLLVMLGSPDGIFRIHQGAANALLLAGCFAICFLSPRYFKIQLKTLFLTTFFAFSFLVTYGRYSNIFGIINNLIFIGTFFFLFALRPEYKTDLITQSTKWLALLLTVSFAAWVLWKCGTNLPHFRYIPNPELANEDSMYVFQHYYFFLTFDYAYFNVNTIARFMAFFIEPGYLGTICLLFIAVNDFNFKNFYVLLLLIMMLISCSLAAYLIFCMTYLLDLLLKKKYCFFLLLCIVGISTLLFLLIYLPDDNIIHVYIFDRLFSEDGIKYNRSTAEFDAYFFDEFLPSWSFLWGSEYGIELAKETRSVDYKMFLVYYGLFGFLLYVLFLWFCFWLNRNRKTFCLTVVMGLILLQSSWLAQYLIYIGIYVLGVSALAENTVESIEKQSISTQNIIAPGLPRQIDHGDSQQKN